MKLSKYFFFLGMFLFSAGLASAQHETKLTVAQDGSGDFSTIQEAIDASKAFPDERVTIFIKNGIYREKVLVPACNTKLSLIGESAEKTILTYDDYFDKIDRGRNSTFYTYTLKVEANDFHAENLTIANTAGPVGQAVALHVNGDRCSFTNCRLLGHQDTLYTEGETSRQYFSDCHIEGTTDFIFGEATAFFERCTIHSLSDSYITAASTPKGKAFGYVFKSCKLTAAEGVKKVFLGRPWRDYAQVVFMNCELGAHIVSEGWANWGGTSRDQTAFYAEYQNSGEGAPSGQRVGWSHQLTKKQARQYTKDKILAPASVNEAAVNVWTNRATNNSSKN
ncbi:pectinesterase family protein [Sunxiuqinia dokdonensis]|uniref:Pectinesterase n=1 Tax=Sunxiuqinia dokdonensis TaxID=1409788 RepID=A0A0L8V4T9_9BACT|nr:pectinesterase family protein [Sunxiuqinia dokdonensis]KOH43454.1 pectinesterase [Sunxiuqinia dokdonensis]